MVGAGKAGFLQERGDAGRRGQALLVPARIPPQFDQDGIGAPPAMGFAQVANVRLQLGGEGTQGAGGRAPEAGGEIRLRTVAMGRPKAAAISGSE